MTPLRKVAYDDVTGDELDPREVVKARAKEMSYVRAKQVWKKVPRAEAARRGLKVIQTRWIDINKGDRFDPNYRSRFVAKEFNDGKVIELAWFAATPPLEALKLLVSDAATRRSETQRRSMMINNVARAFFEAPVQRQICIELLEEDLEGGEGAQDLVGMLEMSLYGTRDAAANFQAEVQRFMKGLGFKVGKYNACTFWHPGRDIKTIVHGDGFVSGGDAADLEWLRSGMECRFEIKTQMLGQRYAKGGKVLNRILRVTPEGWEYEADQRHGEFIVQALGLEGAKGVTSPGEEAKAWLELEDAKLLDTTKASEYRALEARANYLASDRPDIQYAVKEICRTMSQPRSATRRR